MSSSNENVEDDGVDGNPGGELNKSSTSQQLRNGSQISNGAGKFKGTKSMSSNQLQVNLIIEVSSKITYHNMMLNYQPNL